MSTGWRLSILGLVFILMFSALTLRLWQVQVTEAQVNELRAEQNQIALATTPAPRGEIRDRKGRLLAGTRPALAAIVDGQIISDEVAPDLVARLAAFAGLEADVVERLVADARARGDRVTVVGELTDEQAVFLKEHDEDFPGVTVEPQPIRLYPEGELAAAVLGFIGKPDQTDIDEGARPRDLLGKAGVEKYYDDQLRGTPGLIKYQVDAERNGNVLGERKPESGSTLILTIDVDLSAQVQKSLAEGLRLARELYDPTCEPGEDGDPRCPVRAIGVVLDATDGSVLAMETVPTYDPNIFSTGVTQSELDALPEGVFNNFAIQGQFAPASTFKAVTYFTSYEEAVYPRAAVSPDHQILCVSRLEAPFTDGASRLVWRNWKSIDDGFQNIHQAFLRSCNTYFWDIAFNIWIQFKDTDRESILQDWAREFGFGAISQIDLPFERDGIVPDRALFEEWKVTEPYRLSEDRLELASPWFGGDLLQAATGQGSVLVTPLQLANGFAAMVNGGTLWQPRVVAQIIEPDGDVIDNSLEVLNAVELDATTVVSFRQDLQSVVNNRRGTAWRAFADFGANKALVGGKTGTAEVIKGPDGVNTALFVGVAPIRDPKYVVVVIIERGGSGGLIAAPTAKQILQYLLNGEDAVTPIAKGEDAD